MHGSAPTLDASTLASPGLGERQEAPGDEPAGIARAAAREDDRLMERTAGGDSQAFAELVETHKDRLVAYLTRLTGDRARAEDLAQESFVRLYRAAPGYRREGHLKSYLYRIATNLLRSEQRRERRWRWLQPVLEPTLQLRADAAAIRPQRRLLASEAQHQVAAALARLPLRFRAPLVLYEIEGWTYQSIAEALGCREGTVKSRIHRARTRLKAELEPYWTKGRAVGSGPGEESNEGDLP